MKPTFKRYKQRNMWIETKGKIRAVFSYDTHIGYIFDNTNTFVTWGYSRYSSTTSKQITQLCHEQSLKRVDINEDYNINDLIKLYN